MVCCRGRDNTYFSTSISKRIKAWGAISNINRRLGCGPELAISGWSVYFPIWLTVSGWLPKYQHNCETSCSLLGKNCQARLSRVESESAKLLISAHSWSSSDCGVGWVMLLTVVGIATSITLALNPRWLYSREMKPRPFWCLVVVIKEKNSPRNRPSVNYPANCCRCRKSTSLNSALLSNCCNHCC